MFNLRNHNQENKFMESYNIYVDDVFKYCYYNTFCLEKARNLVKKIFCQAWLNIVKEKEYNNMFLSIYRTAYNTIKGINIDINNISETNQTNDLMRAISSLKLDYRDIAILKHVNNLSIKDISEIINEPEDKVLTKEKEAFLQIRDVLNKNYNHSNVY